MTSKKEIFEMLEITTIDFDWILDNLRDLNWEQTYDHIAKLKNRIYRLQLAINSDIERTRNNTKFNRDWKRAKRIAESLNLDYLNFSKFKIRRQEKLIQKMRDNHNI